MSNLTIVILATIGVAFVIRITYKLTRKHFEPETEDDFYNQYAKKEAILDIEDEEPVNYTELDEIFHSPYDNDMSEMDADNQLLEDSRFKSN